MQQRETTTDRLMDVIRVIQLAHRTGTLMVDRGANNTFEEGMVIFVQGTIVQANVGVLSGIEAFQRLISWKVCRFSFIPSSTSSFPITSSTLPSEHSPVTGPFNGPIYSSAPVTGSGMSRDSQGQIPGVPYRTQPVPTNPAFFEQMGLSRAHRRLFLLIDGQRTVPVLACLLGYAFDEVQRLLDDLEFVQLIHQPGSTE